jgi:hypothetical protein
LVDGGCRAWAGCDRQQRGESESRGQGANPPQDVLLGLIPPGAGLARPLLALVSRENLWPAGAFFQIPPSHNLDVKSD